MNNMRSSYKDNNYGKVFENLIYAFTPQICVEIGVLDGYSTLHIAKGLRNAERLLKHKSILYAYDLWEDYPYKHGDISSVRKMLDDEGVGKFVVLNKEDGYTVHNNFDDLSICFVHIDISNDGDTLKKMVKLWYPKLTYGGMIVFEGGSEERDNVDWMKKYNKPKIRDELLSNKLINECFLYGTYELFPSLTVMIKKV